MLRFRLLVHVSLCLSCLSIGSVYGKEAFEWDEVTDSDWAVTQDSALGIHDAAMIFEKVVYDDNLSHHKWDCKKTIYRRIRVLTEKGREQADVDVPLLDADQKIKDIQGRTILPDGSVTELQEDQIFKKEAVRVKRRKIDQYRFSLPAVTADCIIEYVVRYELESPGGIWEAQKEIPLLAGECRWKLAKQLKRPDWGVSSYLFERIANYVWPRKPEGASVEMVPKEGETKEIVFRTGFVRAFSPEPYSFPKPSLKSTVICYYGATGKLEHFWPRYGEDFHEYFERYCDKERSPKEIIESFGPLDGDSAKIAAAFRWTRDSLVNTSFDILLDKNNKEQKVKEHDDYRELLDHRYGDTDDINMVFFDLLRRMGIAARLVGVKERTDRLFVKEAKFWQFDNLIVAVPDGYGYRYISPGHRFNPIDLIPWYCEFVDAIVLGGKTTIVKIPASESSRSLRKLKYDFNVHDDLSVQGNFAVELTGQLAYDVRSQMARELPGTIDATVREYFEPYFPDAEIDSVLCSNCLEATEPLVLSFFLEFEPEGTALEHPILLEPYDYMMAVKNPFTAEERAYEIVFPFAFRSSEEARFHLPSGWTAQQLPKEADFDNRIGACATDYSLVGDTLVVTRSNELKKQFERSLYYPEVKELYETREQLSSAVVVVGANQ
jgi:hypothetical protein